jgi:starvation-inducible outer membrane lipoprotein
MKYIILVVLCIASLLLSGCIGIAAAIRHDQIKARQAGLIE